MRKTHLQRKLDIWRMWYGAKQTAGSIIFLICVPPHQGQRNFLKIKFFAVVELFSSKHYIENRRRQRRLEVAKRNSYWPKFGSDLNYFSRLKCIGIGPPPHFLKIEDIFQAYFVMFPKIKY